MAGGSPFITDAVWWLWNAAQSFIPGVRLGGIYANKSGYHNTVDANQQSWPGNYSIVLPLDLRKPHDKARALDLTMDATQMKLRTGYLQRAALHPVDNRLDGIREFYGTLDSSTVYGLINDGLGTAWRRSTSDASHIWHVHLSFFTDYVNNQPAMEAFASVLSGQTWEEWNGLQPTPVPTVRRVSDMVTYILQDPRSIVLAWPDATLGKWVYTNILPPNIQGGLPADFVPKLVTELQEAGCIGPIGVTSFDVNNYVTLGNAPAAIPPVQVTLENATISVPPMGVVLSGSLTGTVTPKTA
jgi:hypothetical protein